MQPGKATAHDVAPLVFELYRAIRARRTHDSRHPGAAEALRRCEAAWHRLPAHARAVALVVSEAGLSLPDGTRLDGPIPTNTGESPSADVTRMRTSPSAIAE